jgi:hypothetical protein
MSGRLMEWLSFRGSGRLDAIPAKEFGVVTRRTLGNLRLLGHIELEGPAAWRVAPPVLAALPEQAKRRAEAVLCGARTPGVLRRIDRACNAADARIEETQKQDLPPVIRVVTDCADALVKVAELSGIHFQYDAGYTMLACVPSIRDWPRKPCQMAGGRVGTVRRFSGSRARWMPSSLSEARAAPKGFFRIKRDWDWVSIIKSSEDDCAYIDDLAGRMLSAAKVRHAVWDAAAGRFSLPGLLFPPLLIARALVLCTGLLPEFDPASSRVSFEGVNAEMLRLVLSITGLRLA